MAKAWTEERRKKQAEAIRRWKPWEKSTGPKTAEGKERSSMNALKHGGRSRAWKEYSLFLRLNRAFLKQARLIFLVDDRLKKTEELLEKRAKSNR